DFESLFDATRALKCGVSGPVSFKLLNDTFNESLSLQKAIGASKINTITFYTPKSKVNNVVLISKAYSVLNLSKASHYYFKNITFTTSQTKNNNTLIELQNNSNHNVFDSCKIMGNKATLYTLFAHASDSNTITNSHVTGSQFGIKISGIDTARFAFGNSVIGNKIRYYQKRAFEADHNFGLTFTNNNIDSTTTDSTLCRAHTTVKVSNSYRSVVKANKIFSYGEAFHLNWYYAYVNNKPKNTQIANNLFVSSGNNGVRLADINGLSFLHNTLVLQTINEGAVFGNIQNATLVNNIFFVRKAGNGGLTINSLVNSYFDYNNLFIKGTNMPIVINKKGYNNQNQLSNIAQINTRGTALNPYFYNFKPTTGALVGKGLTTTTITDIDQKTRISLTDTLVDIGCHELNPAQYALAIKKIIAPISVTSVNNNVIIAIENTGTDTFINEKILVHYSTDSGKTYIADTLNITKLEPGDTINFKFKQQWQPIRTGTFLLKAKITKALTQNAIDSSSLEIELCTGIAGVYTIGKNKDFENLAQAAQALQCGITGSVVFMVDSGTYEQQIIIDKIKGASASHTVTFLGYNKATIQYHGTSKTDRYGLILKGAKNVSFNGFIFTGVGIYASGVMFTQVADYNSIKNCVFNFPTYSQYENNLPIAFSSHISGVFDGKNGSYNHIDSCQFIGGYAAISINGIYGFGCRGNIISNNQFNKSHLFAIQLKSCDSTFIIGNTLIDSLRRVYNGIGLKQCSRSNIFNNIIRAQTPIRFESENTANPTDTSHIYNNQMPQASNAFVALGSNNINYYHNSTVCSGDIIYESNCKGLNIANNQFYSTKSGNLMVLDTADFNLFDFNNYYTPNSNYYGRFNGTDIYGLKAFVKVMFPHNQRVYNQEPWFKSSSNLHLSKLSPQFAGKYVNINRDFDGDKRCKVSPMVGADEGNGVNSIPKVRFNIDDSLAIDYEIVVINNSNTSGGELIYWYLNDTLVSKSSDFTFTPTHYGQYVLKLVHKSCVGIDSLTDTFVVVKAFKAPIANFYTKRKVFRATEPINLF
ncbi:MAG: hypothetical protein ACPGLV_13880, partial [Bacteroidia bacterium]